MSVTGWMTGSGCLPGAAAAWNAIRRCVMRWAGPSICSMTTSGRCCVVVRCSRASSACPPPPISTTGLMSTRCWTYWIRWSDAATTAKVAQLPWLHAAASLCLLTGRAEVAVGYAETAIRLEPDLRYDSFEAGWTRYWERWAYFLGGSFERSVQIVAELAAQPETREGSASDRPGVKGSTTHPGSASTVGSP